MPREKKPLPKGKSTANEPLQAGKNGSIPSENSGNGNPPPSEKRAYGRRLASIGNVKRALADLYRQEEAELVHPNMANARTNTLRTLAEVMSYDLAAEIKEIRDDMAKEARKAGEGLPARDLDA
jgi:hypothetical protein